MPETETPTTTKKTPKAKSTKTTTAPAVEAAVEDNSGALTADLAAAQAEIANLKAQVSDLTPEPEPEPEPLTVDQKLELLCHALRETFLRQGRNVRVSALDDCLSRLGY